MNERTMVAVVGVGKFGQHHARVYRELPGAELAGVYDTDAARAAEMAAAHHCRAFTSLEELMEQADAASMCASASGSGSFRNHSSRYWRPSL